MLTNCPKCGFSQPRDQYCASCGVDMLAYRSPEKSWLQKFTENLFVQLFLVGLLGVISVFLITRNQKESFWSRVHFLRGSTQVSSTKEANHFAASASEEMPRGVSNETLANESASQPSALPSSEEPKLKSLPSRSQARLIYLEVPPALLTKWLEEGQLSRVESSEGVTIGYIPHLQQLLDESKAEVRLIKEEQYPFALNQLYAAKLELNDKENLESQKRRVASHGDSSVTSSAEIPPPGALAVEGQSLETASVPAQKTAPVVTYATLDDDRNETLTGQVEVSLNPQTSFPAQFEMTADQSFFIAGFKKKLPTDKSAGSETVVIFKVDKANPQ
jgi:hypothetical protein